MAQTDSGTVQQSKATGLAIYSVLAQTNGTLRVSRHPYMEGVQGPCQKLLSIAASVLPALDPEARLSDPPKSSPPSLSHIPKTAPTNRRVKAPKSVKAKADNTKVDDKCSLVLRVTSPLQKGMCLLKASNLLNMQKDESMASWSFFGDVYTDRRLAGGGRHETTVSGRCANVVKALDWRKSFTLAACGLSRSKYVSYSAPTTVQYNTRPELQPFWGYPSAHLSVQS
ncbi:hypothetical protein CC80DRAFT_554533 [Byssothecium circinans]|uniref:Uncharacterized protein n=1 Tax=Byssothecium circinans TaxID=147558 RepID=A0A6A5TBY7_9PLEO|nr:hypothetical protein CC80DRAFT_554533 [Byssothecium circinans]